MERRKFLQLAFMGAVGLLSGCASNPDVENANQIQSKLRSNVNVTKHPTPNATPEIPSSNMVVLYDLPNQEIVGKSIVLYQNTPPDFENCPFEFYIDQEAFKRLDNYLIDQGIAKTDSVTKFVVHWPGNPAGSENACTDNQSLVSLELAREVYEQVYAKKFQLKDLNDPVNRDLFIQMTQSQMNYVLFHEAAHIKHCRENTPSNVAEREAIEQEHVLGRVLPSVIRIKLKQNADLNQAISYIQNIRD